MVIDVVNKRVDVLGFWKVAKSGVLLLDFIKLRSIKLKTATTIDFFDKIM